LELLLVRRTEGKHVLRVQYKLGLAYELGRGVSRNDVKACKLYEAASIGGHVKAMFAYAISLDEGRGIPRDASKAASWFHAAARKGSAKAQFSLGIRFAEGRGVAKDSMKARHWFEQVRAASLRPLTGTRATAAGPASMASVPCDLAGSSIALAHRRAITARRSRRGREKTHVTAREISRSSSQAAEQDHAKARCNLGIMYASGIGVAQNGHDAARHYLAAAQGWVQRAMFDLAVLYARGCGCLKDDTAAVVWCERAAMAGDAHACVNMAHVLAGGLVGRSPDRRAARRWLDLARRQGHSSDARDAAVSSLVAAPVKPVPSLAPGLPPTSPKDSRVLPAI